MINSADKYSLHMINHTPLAERMRPKSLNEYIGQQHILGESSGLRKAIESGHIPSMIFWGPPGVGKTTLAQIFSHTLKTPFFKLSAINAGVKDVREVIEKAKKTKLWGSLLVCQVRWHCILLWGFLLLVQQSSILMIF